MKKLEDRFDNKPEATQEIETREKKEVDAPVNVKSKISPVAPVLPPFQSREDRVGRYFKKHLKNFLFDEFSDSFLSRQKNLDFMRGVPIPLRHEDYQLFNGGEGLKILHIAENMAWVMGIDPKFEYTPQYVEFMNQFFNYKVVEGLVKEGRDAAEREDFDNAIIHFRAALVLKSDYLHAMYSYARVCREFYLRGDDDKYIGRFKAESMEYFELLTQVHPRFAQAYYYLGYDYLNLGLYQKAALVWQEFLRRSTNFKDKKEIRQRLAQLEQPITIEKGCNAILAGRWYEGLEILEPFLDTNFKGWWPLHYYLGVAYARTGSNAKAVASFKRVLGINASHVESMNELADLYAISKDRENEKKYRQKAELILSQIAEQEKKDKEQEDDNEED
jgi:tetratricopeptide (TPR) repeat protein